MEKVKALVSEHFGVEALSIKKMAGYESLNYLVKTKEAKYVFKHYLNDGEIGAQLLAESEVLLELSEAFPTLYPHSILAKDGNYVIALDNAEHIRLLTFLEGTLLAETVQTPTLLTSFGQFLARMDQALLGHKSITLEARKINWDLQYCLRNQRLAYAIESPNKRKIVDYYFLQFRECVLPHITYLRKSVIHNDANDWNVLCEGDKVSGIIDFGDMVYAPLINELAIALMYVMVEVEQPIQAATTVIKAYHNILPLQEKELDCLFYLIAGRLCTSVCNSAYGRQENPDNAYISVSEKGAWALLETFLTINPIFATNEFKKACGFEVLIEEDMSKEIERRNHYFSKALSLSYKEPIKMHSSTDGPFDNVLKMKPPLCFTKQNADRVVAEIDRILRGVSDG